jgi:toxin ParE1/3/4
MSRLFFSPSAREDLDDIFDYIVKDNPTAAVRFVGKLKETLRRIAGFPSLGIIRDDLAPGVRCFPVGNYLIFYRSRDVGVEVISVLHGSRDYLRLVD